MIIIATLEVKQQNQNPPGSHEDSSESETEDLKVSGGLREFVF